jgi:hypothetical protein
LIAESQFGSGVECQVIIGLFLEEVLFELMIIKFFFFVPVADFSLGCVAIANAVVVHVKLYIYICIDGKYGEEVLY